MTRTVATVAVCFIAFYVVLYLTVIFTALAALICFLMVKAHQHVSAIGLALLTAALDYGAWWLARWLLAGWIDGGVRKVGKEAGATETVTVWADDRGIRVRTAVGEAEEPWDDLVACEDHGSSVVLRFDLGEAIRLPNDAALEPVFYTARRLVAARQAHDEALQERMARGLSRPETDERAERGLSVVE